MFRNVYSTATIVCRSINPNYFPLITPFRHSFSDLKPTAAACHSLPCSSMATPSGEPLPLPVSSSMASSSVLLEKQFEVFRQHLEDSGSLRDRIKSVAADIESATRLMQAGLLLVHQSRPLPEVLHKAKTQIDVIKLLYTRLAQILSQCPGQYHRYQGDWRTETQTVVSLLAFMHWLETGNLLMHNEAEEKLGLNTSEFGLDIEDYLVGVCFMSNELPRYVINKVTAGDYDTPRKVLGFLTDLHSAFRMLNLRNDFLRKKFDGMKYDLRKVEEVYYDVKIRGLAASGDSKEADETE